MTREPVHDLLHRGRLAVAGSVGRGRGRGAVAGTGTARAATASADPVRRDRGGVLRQPGDLPGVRAAVELGADHRPRVRRAGLRGRDLRWPRHPGAA